MASATVDSPTAASSSGPSDLSLQLDSIPTVDLQLLSQSELYSLSLCSPSTFDPRRCDDVVIPKIDRSVFNESAGSRKQTYFRLRLAPASDSNGAASASSLHRRAPHLRPANHNPHPHFLDSDPENAENRQIVALLKQLFGVESRISVKDDNMQELIPIRVDYSDTMPQLANVVSPGQKRKRGRPRKNENATILVANKVEGQCDNDVAMAMNEIVVYENVEDKDNEIINRDGVEVDLVKLGSMEDPYGEELRRRTEGLGSEEELLEFLKGLDGQWGSRRKKKRIVDASLFGNVLPKGWRLLLSCKKKEGHVWLFCRRYISPNGRQFVSCKEISAYLLSLHGIQDANQPTCVQRNANVLAADKMVIVNTADFSVPNEKREENTVCQNLSPAVASTSGNCEVQVTLKSGDLPAVQVRETLHCEKCNLTFNCQDDFLHHQLSSHRRRSKNGESVTDGVIIKGGKYECQFCHKTFDERHRYNGHVGAHVRNQVKDGDESGAVDVEECVGSVSLDLLPHGNTVVQSSTASKSNVAAEIVRKSANDLSNPCTPQGIIDEQSGDSEKLNDHLGRVDNPMDVDVPKSNVCLDSAAVLFNNDSNDNCGNSGGGNVIKDAVDGVEKSCNAQERGSERCSPFPLDKQTGAGNTNAITLVELERRSISRSVSHSLNEPMESCDIDLDGDDFPHTMDELRPEESKVVDGEALFGFCNRNAGLGDSSAIGDKPHVEPEDHSLRNVGNANGKLISTARGSEQTIFSGSISLTPSCYKEENRDGDVYGIFPCLTLVGVETGACGTKVHTSVESVKHAATSPQEERGIGSSGIVPSWNESGNITGKFKTQVSIGIIDAHEQPKSSECSLRSLSGFEGSCGVEEYINKVSAMKIQGPQVNDAINVRSSESFSPFSSSNDGISADAVNDNKHEEGFKFRSFFPSENGKVFSTENSRSSLHNHAGEESKKEPSGSVLLSQYEQPSDEIYNMNKIFGTQVDGRKFNVSGHSKSHDLSLAFDSRADSSGAELEKYGARSSDIHSGVNQTCCGQINLNSIGHVAAENSKEGRAFGIDLHNSSLSDKTCVFENNFNIMYPGRVWEGPKVDEVGNSGNKFMEGFSSCIPQPVEDVLAGTIWRTGEENLMRSDLTDASTSLVQSSNSFHTFDIISDKDNEGLFGVDHKYGCNTGFEGLTLGRTEPMEYSFMTGQSSSPLPVDSKGFSYNADTHGVDSSFWQGKDPLMQNITGQNQVLTVCVWCRNEFYQDPTTSGAQTAAIGSICPGCSSRISRQFNVL